MPNQLIHETSPYLLQHANNPVDWYAWGEEALRKARDENKPIFLSIGYAACHWCHVMEHESFEDPQTARLLNENFVSIKVDREERPDLDSIYMNAVVAMTGQGGWPMSIFMTPQGEPFYGGTYFPPARRYGMPSFSEVLNAVAKSWQNDGDEIRRVGREMARHLQESNEWGVQADSQVRSEVLQQAAQALINTYDWSAGGWGHAPRFPQPMSIDFLLMQASRGFPKAEEAASHVLEIMSRGGLYDVVGGGFHRYSTDDAWLVPHFEKMLYDNAQLALAYLHAYLISGNVYFRRICTETLDFILREMTHPDGGFYSSLDADSEGEEGKFYVWTTDEINQCLADKGDRDLLSKVYPFPERGNFEGKIILQRKGSIDQAAADTGLSMSDLMARLDKIHARLLEFRQQRVRPSTDDKVLVSWNALALRAFAETARYLKRPDYLSAAQKNASFLLSELYKDGQLHRAWRDGRAKHPAFIEDHASLITALLELYQADADIRWYQSAVQLGQEMFAYYRDPRGGFFDTRAGQEDLITRPKEIQDNATPSGNALAGGALLRLAEYSGNGDMLSIAEGMLAAVQDYLSRHPNAFAYWLQDLDFAVGPVQQVAVIGDALDPERQEMLDYIWHTYRPRMVVSAVESEFIPGSPELLRDRIMVQGKPTVYVCEGFVCKLPVNDLESLKKQVD